MAKTKIIKRIPGKYATDALERDALKWINNKATGYDNGVYGVLKDLAHGGCSSGMVSHLIYTADCSAYYDEHQKIIDRHLNAIIEDTGSTPAELFEHAGWEKTDPLARSDSNKGILAWFGFEEACRELGIRAGIEL